MTEIPSQPIKVLCVEDERFIGELYTRALVKEGYDVTVANNGLDGFDKAKTNTYDIILLDIMIPQILGIDVLKKLRAEVPELKSKIIITTNLELDDKAREGIEREADAYLIKAEITPKQLVEFLDNLKLA